MRGVWILMGVAALFTVAALVWVTRVIASESRPAEGQSEGRAGSQAGSLPGSHAESRADEKGAAGNSASTVHDFKVTRIDGSEADLAAYRGKALLIVNTASRCGFTPQYAGLEKLYEKYHDRGFEILAFPANNFMGQEPGTDAEIEQFCQLKYKTTFPLFSKISVKGNDIHPLYRYLTTASGHNGDIGWNFNKFVVAPDGTVRARFGSRQDPLSAELTAAVEAVLPSAHQAK